MSDPQRIHAALTEEISTVLVGREDLVERLTIALLTRGHVLLEGVPGVAKTTAANLFANAIGLEYNRVQMTPDILPADIVGTHVYREQTGEFALQKGPIFGNVVLADEINRATPKTQSALLEAMQEGSVTIEGETLDLPDPFMVIATQNPVEMEGVFELPEAQRDRFQLKLRADLPDRDDEAELLDRFDDDPELDTRPIQTVITPRELLDARDTVAGVHVEDAVKQYILDIVTASRTDDNVDLGASPRASLALLNTAKARAALHDRDYVIPDDVKALAEPVLAHRLILSTDADLSDLTSRDVVTELLDDVAPPSATTDSPAESSADD